jgi:deoxyribose-phosphate aldolase
MRKNTAPHIQVKAAGGVRTLDDLLKVKETGVTRVGATATVAILEEAKKRLGQGSGYDFSKKTEKDSGY